MICWRLIAIASAPWLLSVLLACAPGSTGCLINHADGEVKLHFPWCFADSVLTVPLAEAESEHSCQLHSSFPCWRDVTALSFETFASEGIFAPGKLRLVSCTTPDSTPDVNGVPLKARLNLNATTSLRWVVKVGVEKGKDHVNQLQAVSCDLSWLPPSPKQRIDVDILQVEVRCLRVRLMSEDTEVVFNLCCVLWALAVAALGVARYLIQLLWRCRLRVAAMHKRCRRRTSP
ncbi:unnamed protein product [Polarella glacialis]|uniref:Transmembrane 9 superfamily member n=1 Tax=Polarella glacialis TaxID=89957 RepID=A0A813JTG0_POLGL|nr:unnamed protein product [Polarella glacialis]